MGCTPAAGLAGMNPRREEITTQIPARDGMTTLGEVSFSTSSHLPARPLTLKRGQQYGPFRCCKQSQAASP
jgi:hypothetical protein